MKFPFFLIASIIFGITMAQDFSESDIQIAFSNDRIFRLYFGCLVGEIICTPKGQRLKDILPHIMSNSCADCSEQQRMLAKKVILSLKTQRAAEWMKLKMVYDPQNIYSKNLDSFLAS